MTDRRLALSTGSALTALAAGVVAVATSQPAFGVVAGIAGAIAGGGAAALAGQLARSDQARTKAERHIVRLGKELDALSDTYSDEVRRSAAAARMPESAKEKAEHAFDPATGLYDERYFAVLVQQQVAAARRSLRPISVVIFELDSLADAAPADRDQGLMVVGDVIRRTLRESDSACRLGDVMVGAILEDTAEAGGVWAAERVRGMLLATPAGDALTVSAGVACYPSHALGAAELVQQAGKALDEARRHGADRVEIAPEA